jgi:hypothetical protein
MPAKKRFSAMQFSLKRLRDDGHTCCIVEQSVTLPGQERCRDDLLRAQRRQLLATSPQPALRGIPIQAGRLEHCGRNRH